MKSLSKIYGVLNQTQVENTALYLIRVLSNLTLHTLEPYLRFYLLQRQIHTEIQFGNYDNAVQECLKDDSSLITHETQCTLILLDPFKISPSLQESAILQYLETCLHGIRKRNEGLILVYTNQLTYPAEGVLSEILPQGTNKKIRKLNLLVEEKLAKHRGIYTIPLDLILMRVGEQAYWDHRSLHAFQNPYSLDAYNAIAQETTKYICASLGRTKKCLVLDADHVLWHGIIGEDKWDRITINQSFQKAVLTLHRNGTLLALCSKNEPSQFWHFFDTHPDILLKREHFSSYRINWKNKADNIREIAQELNIGLESIVFADDSPNEIAWVQGHLPEVTCLHLPKTEAHLNTRHLLQTGLFDRINLTTEDTQRGQYYEAEKSRAKLKQTYFNIHDFLVDLNMELEIRKASTDEASRLAQLTQKTNQFNLTTRRYTEAEIHAFLQSPSHFILSARLKDKFGNLGTIGLAIVEKNAQSFKIDTLLLSCRALGRGVEQCLLNCILGEAWQNQIKRIEGEYRLTPANQQTASFYPQQNFTTLIESHDVISYQYEYKNEKPSLLWPNYYLTLDAPHFTQAKGAQ